MLGGYMDLDSDLQTSNIVYIYIYIYIYIQLFTRNPICWVSGRNSGVQTELFMEKRINTPFMCFRFCIFKIGICGYALITVIPFKRAL